MLYLNQNSIKEGANIWKKVHVELPRYEIEKVKRMTKEKPQWIHFGAGNIFRGFIANAHQKLLNKELAETGIIATETFDVEMIEKVYKPYDNLTLLVTMNANGAFDKTIINSIAESLAVTNEDDFNRLEDIFENPSLQIASFTITEKGYSLTRPSGEFLEVVERDIKTGWEKPFHTMSIVTALVYKRYLKGQYPLTLVSMDNCSQNGDKLKQAVLTIAKEWFKNNYVDSGFISYLEDEQKITFPLSMIDKITPRPSEQVKEVLEKNGLEGMDVIVTSKNTYTAPFVNAESSEYLVIEDKFTNGRPKLEEAGIIFTDRETVNKVETMKVTTCLNPLHTALAVTGCLLGYTLISEEMRNPLLRKFIETIGYEEGIKVVVDPKIISPKDFLDEVINERFSNPYIPDTPQRIATDTSQKVGIRFGETIKSYMKDKNLNLMELKAIPLAIAAWCRYLLGVDDEGKEFTISPDPLLDGLKETLQGVKLGDQSSNVKAILSNETIFGINLYEIGLGEKIENMFYEMNKGNGAVRHTLEKYIIASEKEMIFN